MSSSRAGEAGAEGGRERSPRRGRRLALALMLAPIVLVALGRLLGFAYYRPVQGEVADPGTQAAEAAERRDRVTVAVGEEMAPGGKGRPTLASVAAFFALEEDTLACTVEENFGEEAAAKPRTYARRPLKVGGEVVLCLD